MMDQLGRLLETRAPRKSLLIVESDRDLLSVFTRRLLRRGFSVTSVHHPRQALRAVNVCSYRAAIIDGELPEVPGMELMRRLRRRLGNLKVILISGHADEAHRQLALGSGIDEYLCKPFELSELEAAVRRALRSDGGMPLAAGVVSDVSDHVASAGLE